MVKKEVIQKIVKGVEVTALVGTIAVFGTSAIHLLKLSGEQPHKPLAVQERVIIVERIVPMEVTTTNKQLNIDEEYLQSEKPISTSEIAKNQYFDIPLEHDLQDYIIETAEAYEIAPELVIAIIERESRFDASIMGDSGRSYGLMQIQKRWHEQRMADLGCDDLLDPYQNILVGIDYLAELQSKGNSLEWVLMAYNGGVSYANKRTTSDYAEGVKARAEELRKEY